MIFTYNGERWVLNCCSYDSYKISPAFDYFCDNHDCMKCLTAKFNASIYGETVNYFKLNETQMDNGYFLLLFDENSTGNFLKSGTDASDPCPAWMDFWNFRK